MSHPFQLNWRTNIYGKGSYAIVGRELAIAAWALGWDSCIDPLHARLAAAPRVDLDDRRLTILRRLVRRTAQPVSAQIHLRCLSQPNERELALGEARPLLEADGLNVALFAVDGARAAAQAQYEAAQGWDLLLTPSTHSARALLNSGVAPHRVGVVPHGVDRTVFHPAATPMALPTSARTRLLVHTTPWIQRKNLEGAFRAFFTVYRGSDDVALIVHCPIKHDRRFAATGELIGTTAVHEQVRALCERIREETGGSGQVVYLFQDFGLIELAGLYTACHALVHPHRAEGFGMCILEAMACGLPAIATAWSGNMDYCSPETNLLLPYRLVQGVQQSTLTWAEPDAEPMEWAEPDFDALCSALESIVAKPEAARAIGRRAARRAAGWSWARAARTLIRLLTDRCGVEIGRRRHVTHTVPA
jgi:glycosyltransferase involved in cell wall biosynthesis